LLQKDVRFISVNGTMVLAFVDEFIYLQKLS